MLSGKQVFYLDKITGLGQIQMASRIGSTLPAQNSGLGKALISTLPEDEWADYFNPAEASSPYSQKDVHKYLAELETIRTRGYSLDLEEREVGVCCIGCVVKDAGGCVVAAISVSKAMVRESVKVLEEMIPMVVKTAAKISHSLGNRSALG